MSEVIKPSAVLNTIYLVRHATPDWSRVDLPYHLPPGPPLTAQGAREAAELGQFLRAMGVRQILASPLERCTQTAAIAGPAAGAAVQVDARLLEVQPGETGAQVLARVRPAWDEAGAASAAYGGTGSVALITHGGPVAVLLAELGVAARTIDDYQRRFDRRNALPPGGAWRAARLGQGGPWSLELAFIPAREGAAAAVPSWLV